MVSNYEAGQRRIDLLELLLITNALGADPKALFGEIATYWVRKKRRVK